MKRIFEIGIEGIMTPWDILKQQVYNSKKNSPKEKSIAKSLLAIYDQAEKWGIEPTYVAMAEPTKLEEIIREARAAIKASDKDHLEELFNWAATLSTVELRIRLKRKRGTIMVEKLPVEKSDKGECYRLMVNEEQLERIKASTQLQYQYIIQD